MAPVIVAGNDEQKKRFLGRMIDEPLMCVCIHVKKLNQFVIKVFRDIVSQNLLLAPM